MIIIRPCPVCGASPSEPNILGRSRPQKRPDLEIDCYDFIKCRNCGLYFLSPLPTLGDFQKLYSSETWKPLDGEQSPIAMTYSRNRLNAIIKEFGFDLGACSILEIGAGYSWLARAAKSLDHRVRTVAQDINPTAEYCPWVDRYFIGNIDDVISKIKGMKPFTIISMTHVIEHLPYPKTVLNVLRDLIDDEGVIFVTAPYRPKGWDKNSSFSIWEQWQYYQVPGHLQFFDENTLARLGKDTGFSLAFFSNRPGGGEALEAWLHV